MENSELEKIYEEVYKKVAGMSEEEFRKMLDSVADHPIVKFQQILREDEQDKSPE